MSTECSPSLQSVERLARSSAADDPFAAAVRGARLPMVVTATQASDYVIVFANDAFLALTGYAADEVLGRNPRFLQGPDTDPDVNETMRAALRAGHEIGVEVLNYRKDGAPFWCGMFLSPVRDEAGEVAYWFGSQLDITARKEAEFALNRAHDDLEASVEQRTESLRLTAQQKTVLLHEVEHRVKNNLQLISSLIQFQSRRTDDPAVKEALSQVQDRVSAVSTVHRRLFQTVDAGCFDVAQFLRDLAEDLVGRAHRPDIRIRLDLQPVKAPASRAAPLALLVNEILAHALKSEFPAPRPGALDIRLNTGGDRFTIELSDDGASPADDRRESFAAPSGIVEILRRQLGAKIDWRDNRPGAAALISLPMEQPSS